MSKNNSIKRQAPVTHCIFCGEPDPTSEEHIISAWIYRALKKANIHYDQLLTIRHQLPDGEIDAESQVVTDDATCPILCFNCNNKFSGDIQSKASKVLTQFFIGRWSKLDAKEINILLRWYTCYLMVREYNHDNHETHSHSQKEMFRKKGEFPRSLNIWIAPLYDAHLFTNHRAIAEIDLETQTQSPLHISVFAVGHLLVVSFGANPIGEHGINTQSFMRLKKFLHDLRFVQLKDFNPKLEISFPVTKPGYFVFPGVFDFTEILETVLSNGEVNFAPYLDFLPSKFELLW